MKECWELMRVTLSVPKKRENQFNTVENEPATILCVRAGKRKNSENIKVGQTLKHEYVYIRISLVETFIRI